ncbi:helix-turn-helix transcriptional regulator [Roseovarius aquimarinus]|uniref:Helix-turn-helix transcriptional regulator n=1 Tax=Roseovarius aquimarinus TaxID=1229156 RepID=A0ABW7I6K3_9RHOB
MTIENRIYNRGEVEEMTGLSKSSLYRLMYAGDFPQTVQLSPRRVGWSGSALRAWLAERGAL